MTAIKGLWASVGGRCGLLLFALILILALLGPLLAPQNPYDPSQLDILDARLPPGSMAAASDITYWLGSDGQGRDMLSAICHGLRISLLVGLCSSGLALLLGLLAGLIAAYAGRWVEAVIMRLVDIQLAFPSLLIALILLAVLGPGSGKIVIALVASQWAYFARSTRATVLAERGKDYIAAVHLLRLPAWRILFVHLLPNCLPTLRVITTLQIAAAISLEATLSFLGLGLPVNEPSLGLLIANGFQFLLSGDYWISVFPGLALLLTLLAIQLIADGLRGLDEGERR